MSCEQQAVGSPPSDLNSTPAHTTPAQRSGLASTVPPRASLLPVRRNLVNFNSRHQASQPEDPSQYPPPAYPAASDAGLAPARWSSHTAANSLRRP
ncbi:hypothetical protein KFK09_024666 [Dendrobium nobile]|uniref:Uncharacterized protein n=1 Tax=Dendrobium nobile TaxID=94219 RepID=A0A8T3AEF3_DENNO|nr:hypothetical protein KFK09_024666 [Dendrobium nobile]